MIGNAIKKLSKDPRWPPFPVSQYLDNGAAQQKLFKRKIFQMTRYKLIFFSKIQDGRHFRFSYILQSVHPSAKLFK
jgi:hypothetical protein